MFPQFQYFQKNNNNYHYVLYIDVNKQLQGINHITYS